MFLQQHRWQEETLNNYKSMGLNFAAGQKPVNRLTTIEEFKTQFNGLFRIINESATKVWEASVGFLNSIPPHVASQVLQECSKRPLPRRKSESTQETARSPPPSRMSAHIPRETKGAIFLNYASVRAGPEKQQAFPLLFLFPLVIY